LSLKKEVNLRLAAIERHPTYDSARYLTGVIEGLPNCKIIEDYKALLPA